MTNSRLRLLICKSELISTLQSRVQMCLGNGFKCRTPTPACVRDSVHHPLSTRIRSGTNSPLRPKCCAARGHACPRQLSAPQGTSTRPPRTRARQGWALGRGRGTLVLRPLQGPESPCREELGTEQARQAEDSVAGVQRGAPSSACRGQLEGAAGATAIVDTWVGGGGNYSKSSWQGFKKGVSHQPIWSLESGKRLPINKEAGGRREEKGLAWAECRVEGC